MKPIIAITTGDTNGVGYEVLFKALLESHMFELIRPVVYGNAAVAKHHLQTLDDDRRNVTWNIIDTPEQAKDSRMNLIVSYPDDVPVQFGTATEA
ncbi:MAG: 4-hydroxythreonine-4-phosphate dehydrogenase, partial [Paludibacteraceae bacterium]|nr:4-hydroxythreonine-4-phosphate dehydrogenase [Paludibacteraceae bacterium]